MKRTTYIYRSLRYYFKQHLTLLIGTMISTAVLTGALIIGDSVDHSLKSLTKKRLGNITHVLETGERFFSDGLSQRIYENGDLGSSSILHLKTMVVDPERDLRIHEADIYGVDSSFLEYTNGELGNFEKEGIFISENIAQRLGLSAGQEILLKIRNIDAIPVRTPFAVDKPPAISIRISISKVLNEREFSRFNLLSDQKAPYNIFIDKELLQSKTGLNKNANLLVFNEQNPALSRNEIQDILQQSFKPADASLRIDTPGNENLIEIISDRVFIDHAIDKSLENLGAEKILSYLVNGLKTDKKLTPYSFVSGLSERRLPFPMKDDELILNSWCAEDLGVLEGDSVTLEYYTIGPFKQLENRKKSFVVKSIMPNQGPLFQKDLMPDFPGLSDAESCSEWDTGIPVDLEKIRDKDEKYWDDFGGTPKAIVSYEIASSLWGNMYGESTALRLSSSTFSALEEDFGNHVPPENLGFYIRDVKEAGLSAASNGVDFGELFLSLSFFVIAAGVLLLVLLYSLNMLSRRNEIDRLRALGFSKKSIFRLLFSEVMLTVVIGNILGVLLGLLYNKLILWGLNGLWKDAVRTNALEIYIDPVTILIGFFAGTLIALLTVFFVLRNKLSSRSVLRQLAIPGKSKIVIFRIIAWVSFAGSIIYVIYSVFDGRVNDSTSYMATGALLIFSLLVFFWLYLVSIQSKNKKSPTINSLAMSYLARNRQRSMLVVTLMALGTFSVLVTGMNRKTFYGTETDNTSGTGGYLFWLETAFPLVSDPGSPEGKIKYGFEDETITDSISFLPLLKLDGDDASCLNLNQVETPALLGIDPSIPAERNSFSFTGLMEGFENNDPWRGLENEFAEGVIPAFIDQTVITWGLIKSIGDTLVYQDEFGRDLNIIIAGGLGNTIFQGYVLISQKNMLKYFPSVPGAGICLVDADKKNEEALRSFFDFYFGDYGVDYSTTYEKLDEFNSVTNTYLNVFLVLGALGLLIGTVGFGIVLLRNRMERRSERAIMLATGIRRRNIKKMLKREHLMLLYTGILIACSGALLASVPSMFSEAYSMPYIFIVSILVLILLSSWFWITLFSGLKEVKNLSDHLRKE